MAISSGWPGAGSYYLGRHGEGEMKRPLYLTTPMRGTYDPESMQGPNTTLSGLDRTKSGLVTTFVQTAF